MEERDGKIECNFRFKIWDLIYRSSLKSLSIKTGIGDSKHVFSRKL